VDEGIQILFASHLKRGLVIGKFLPVHIGHLALIDFAKRHCDELIVSMSYTATDPIDSDLRLAWLKSIFENRPDIVIEKVVDDFDDESKPLEARTKLWAHFIQRKYPPIDLVISSEEYGEPFARNMGAGHLTFDAERNILPISATQIRRQPMKYWNFIPEIVKPYFLKKVCFYGAESTGKSTMAKKMATYYNTDYVPEVAREMITSNDFTLDDIIAIGKAQAARVIDKSKLANKVLFCDTDAITTQIYSEQYLHEVPKILYQLEGEIKYDKYFLFEPDVPWVSDGLRDLGHRRDEMAERFKKALEKRNIPYVLVQGSWEERFEIIRNEVDELLLG
jgi:HTH-type transcriptional repressor of NAD biosynthesis genes